MTSTSVERGPSPVMVQEVQQFMEATIQRFRKALRKHHEANGPDPRHFAAYISVEVLVERIYHKFCTERGQPVLPDRLLFPLQAVPALSALADLQMRLTAKVQCACSTRPLVTLFELEGEICAQEGVENFAELGLGVGLQCLPVAQSFFEVSCQTAVYPVTSTEVLQFLVHDVEASRVIDTASDCRTLVQLFSQFYQRTVLEGNTVAEGSPLCMSSPLTGRERLRREAQRRGCSLRVHNIRHLGLHIQSFAWLVMVLRQERGRLEEDLRRAAVLDEVRIARNRPVYEGMVFGFDELLRHQGDAAPPCGAHLSALTVSVPINRKDASSTTIPENLWETVSDSPKVADTVNLRISVGPQTSTVLTQRQPTRSRDGEEPLQSQSRPTAPSTVSASSPISGAAPRRRKGGKVITDDDDATVIITTPVTLLSPTVPPAQAATDANHVAPTGLPKTVLPSRETPEGTLHRLLLDCQENHATFDAEAALESLSMLTPGTRVAFQDLRSTFSHLSKAFARTENVSHSRDFPFIPIIKLPDTSLGRRRHKELLLSSGDNVRKAPGSDLVVEVLSVASVSEVAWAAPGGNSSNFSEENSSPVPSPLLFTTLQPLYGDDVESLFVEALGVAATPTLTSLLSSLAISQCVCDASVLTTALEKSFTEALVTGVKNEYTLFCQSLETVNYCAEKCSNGAVIPLFARHIRSIRERYHRVRFPIQKQWHDPLTEELYFYCPRWVGLSGLKLRCVSHSTRAPPLVGVEISEEEMTAPLAAALEALGLHHMEKFVNSMLTMDTLEPSAACADLHLRVGAVAPYVQATLRKLLPPSDFDVLSLVVSERLRRFRVVLGSGLRRTDTLVSFSGYVYTDCSTVSAAYVPQHLTLYGDSHDGSPAVLAAASLPLFLPYGIGKSATHTVLELLERLFAALSSVCGVAELPSDREHPSSRGSSHTNALARAVHDAAGAELRHLVEAEKCSPALWQVPPIPPTRFYTCFPQAADGFSAPAPHRYYTEIRSAALRALHTQASETQNNTGSSTGRDKEGAILESSHHRTPAYQCRLPEWELASETGEQPSLFRSYQELAKSLPAPRVFSGKRPRDEVDCCQDGDLLKSGASALTQAPHTMPRTETCSHVRASSDADDDDGPDDDVPDQILFVHRPTAGHAASSAKSTETEGPLEQSAARAERLVFETLQSQYSNDRDVEVVWVNQHNESGEPYDIVVTSRRQQSGRQHSSEPCRVLFYVEVKSTTSADRASFEMSPRELIFAARYGRNYRIYRVFSVNSNKPKIRIIPDVMGAWRRSQVIINNPVVVTMSPQLMLKSDHSS